MREVHQIHSKLPKDLHRKLKDRADRERRSVNDQLIILLAEALGASPAPIVTARKTPPTRATRLPEDFKVTPEMVAWARKETPRVDGRRETQKFKDHWQAASGANASKRDWVAAWRNWMRKAADRGESPTQAALTDELPSAWR